MVLCWWVVASDWQLNANGCSGVSRAAIEVFNLLVNCTVLTKTNRAFLNNYYLVWGDGVEGFEVGWGA